MLVPTGQMTVEEALAIVDAVLEPERLSHVQQLVLCRAWSGKTYQQIADEIGYSADHVRDVGFELWKLLSGAFGEKVTKNNVFSVIRQRRVCGSRPATLAREAPLSRRESLAANLVPCAKPEFPGGQVSLGSPFYVERPPVEELCYKEILQPGSLIWLRAPQQMGKTSLMARILATAAESGCRTVRLNLQQADATVLNHLDRFLRWFCVNVSRQLNLKPVLDDYWDQEMGSKVSCTAYFEGYLLQQIEAPIVLAIDEMNRIFEYPQTALDFLPLLRFWKEEAHNLEIWQKLRLLVVQSTEIHIPLNINKSPFNVGLPIKLPEFNREQVLDLALRHGLDWTASGEVDRLVEMVGGHPYLIRLAFYHLCHHQVNLDELLQEAPTLAGIYSDRLWSHLTVLQENPELAIAFKKVVTASESVQLDNILAYKLESMGLVKKLSGDECTPSCNLYRLYFRNCLT